jgi:hypothetical protein
MERWAMAIALAACSVCIGAGAAPYEPTSSYEARDIEGWTVHVSRSFVDERTDLHRNTLEVLRQHLYQINRVVPKPALEKLHEVPIWVEAESEVKCMCYHPSREWLTEHDFNPAKAKAVELGNPKNFLNWTTHQWWMILHELAHAYHDRVLGWDNAEVLAAYERAVASKTYDSVLRHSGKRDRAYALNNQKEYFAELSEAYFGVNDFYPFVRAELMEHDAEGYKVVKRMWEQGAASDE